MRKLLLGGVATWIFGSAAALAADMPVKAPALAPQPALRWTGCYLGGNIGGGWARTHYLDNPSFDIVGSTTHASSLVGGGQLGCDYQSGTWVFGLQGMFDGAAMKADSPFFNGKGFSNRIPWLASATGRVGYLLQPAFLVYVRGGAAFVRDDFKFIRPGLVENHIDKTRTGALVGGGFEWMSGPNWTVFIEYDFMGLGTHTTNFGFAGPPAQPVKQNVQTVLIGVNFRFGSVGR
jgi:outer membrane immunogenic protein